MKNSTIIYSLTIEDIQTVANQEIGRELVKIEIKKIEETIADKINWYEAIADSINEELSLNRVN